MSKPKGQPRNFVRTNVFTLLAFVAAVIGLGLTFLTEWLSLRVGGVTAIGLCLVAMIVRDLQTGVIRSNWGEVSQTRNPDLFWVTMFFWVLLSIAFTIGLFVHAMQK